MAEDEVKADAIRIGAEVEELRASFEAFMRNATAQRMNLERTHNELVEMVGVFAAGILLRIRTGDLVGAEADLERAIRNGLPRKRSDDIQ